MPGYRAQEDWQPAQDLALAALKQFWTAQATSSGTWCFTRNGRDWIVTPMKDPFDLVHTVDAMRPFGFRLPPPPNVPPVDEDLGELAVQAARLGWAVRRHREDGGNRWSFRWGTSTKITRRVEGQADLNHLCEMLEAPGRPQAITAAELPVPSLRSVPSIRPVPQTPGRAPHRRGAPPPSRRGMR